MSCFVCPAQRGSLGRAALTQPRAQPSPADVQGQHPKPISHFVFPCWGSAEIDGDPIFIPGGKEGKCAVRKGPQEGGEAQFLLFHISLFNPEQPSAPPRPSMLSLGFHSLPCPPGRELTDVPSLCPQDVWEVQILSAL